MDDEKKECLFSQRNKENISMVQLLKKRDASIICHHQRKNLIPEMQAMLHLMLRYKNAS
jgi:hypothetical protein